MRIFPALLCALFLSACQSSHTSMDHQESHAHTNRLSQETSPYLLQHQHNPVDWFPWGEEAFAKAKKDCEAEVYKMYEEVITEEKTWADYLFKMGPVIGLNANILKEFVNTFQN